MEAAKRAAEVQLRSLAKRLCAVCTHGYCGANRGPALHSPVLSRFSAHSSGEPDMLAQGYPWYWQMAIGSLAACAQEVGAQVW